ncbi:ABC transporter ATP-binding protein [uncultured Desulfobacter sp.]|uniref:ABC transporter ATP-binding protein n=1 Tax=uncultured Desulfobacter sp. TaxID=240139 RepID=UPI002AAB8ACD|nr:ABC transporter ATP-binding protein [uncultured Desulfobacter sp.]
MQLEITNLNKTYAGKIAALKDVSLTIGTGMFGLLGENGAGKSSLMRILATLQDADSGTVRFNDIDVLAAPEKLRRQLGYLPQEFGVYPSVSAEELLTHIADLKGIASVGERKDQVDALLQKVNLWDQRKRKIGGFSGGMKQRFGIAQALLGNPKLIIVDEPTAGLDPVERNRFYNLLSEIGEHTVVILSTHIVEDVSTLCNNMAILGRGRVLRVGTPGELEQSLDGLLWTKSIQKEELDGYRERTDVLSSHFHLGTLNLTICAEADPGDGFVPKPPSLADTYFHTLKTMTSNQ